MVEKKESTKQEVVKEETVEKETKPFKKEESGIATYLIIALVVVGALGADYYLKVVKKKGAEEAKALEEEDNDSFFAEVDESESIKELHEDEENKE